MEKPFKGGFRVLFGGKAMNPTQVERGFPAEIKVGIATYRRAMAFCDVHYEKLHHAIVLLWPVEGEAVTLNGWHKFYDVKSAEYTFNFFSITYVNGWSFTGKLAIILHFHILKFILISVHNRLKRF